MRSCGERLPVGRLDDGMWLFAPVGELVELADGSAVVCHACGEPLTWVSAAHLQRHGLDQAAYRERFGLNRKQALGCSRLQAERAAEGARRYATNEALRKGLGIGQAMAGDGRLNRLGVEAQPRGSRRAQGRTAAGRDAAAPALRRVRDDVVEQARRRSEEAAQALGFAGLDAYAADRRAAGASVSQVRAELRIGWKGARALLGGEDQAEPGPGRQDGAGGRLPAQGRADGDGHGSPATG